MVGASGRKFSPLDISGCVLWLKADGDVYNTGTTQATDGQTVSTWKDASGNGRDATYFNGDKATFETSFVNGKPALLSHPTGGGLMTFSLPTLTAGTLFWAGIHRTSYTTVFYLAGAVESYYPIFGEGKIAFGSAAQKVFTMPSGATDQWNVLTVVADSNWNFRQNGVSAHSTSNTFSSPTSTNYLVFNKPDYALAEFGIYDTALSAANREAVEDYLGTKYGITITH